MFRARALSLFSVLFLLVAGETLGAPLRLVTSQMEARISGNALGDQGPASYSASSASSSSWSCRLADSVAVLQPTALGGGAGSAGSAAGIRIEQPAANEFVFTLSAASNGVYQPGADPGVSGSGYRAYSHAFLKASVAVDPYPGHPIGTPATFQITVEHVGDMSSRNNAYTFNRTEVMINGRLFGYHKSLSLPQELWGDFTDLTVHGHRDTTVSQAFSGAIGGTINLMALFDSQSSAFVGSDGAVDFEDGLRIHLTVMPEPSAVVLGLLGLGLAMLRRRR